MGATQDALTDRVLAWVASVWVEGQSTRVQLRAVRENNGEPEPGPPGRDASRTLVTPGQSKSKDLEGSNVIYASMYPIQPRPLVWVPANLNVGLKLSDGKRHIENAAFGDEKDCRVESAMSST
jgi:hypothetical protein